MFVGLKYLKNAVPSPPKPASEAKQNCQNTKMIHSLWLERKYFSKGKKTKKQKKGTKKKYIWEKKKEEKPEANVS